MLLFMIYNYITILKSLIYFLATTIPSTLFFFNTQPILSVFLSSSRRFLWMDSLSFPSSLSDLQVLEIRSDD